MEGKSRIRREDAAEVDSTDRGKRKRFELADTLADYAVGLGEWPFLITPISG